MLQPPGAHHAWNEAMRLAVFFKSGLHHGFLTGLGQPTGGAISSWVSSRTTVPS